MIGTGDNGCWDVMQLKHVSARAVVLFLVSAVERNIYDQRILEYHIYENHVGVKVIRRTLQQIRASGFLEHDHKLIVLVYTYMFILILRFCQVYKSSLEI